MDDNHRKLDDLMRELEGKDRVNEQQCTLMFNLNNILFPHAQEHTKSCPACRERVYRRLKEYWTSKKN